MLKHRLTYYLNKSWVLILLLVNSGCVKEVDIELESKGGTPTLFSFVHPDSVVSMSLTRSVSILSTKKYEYISGGGLQLYKNGTFYKNVWYPADVLWKDMPGVSFEAGDSINLNVYIDDNLAVSASTMIPEKVLINQIDTSRVYKKGSDGSIEEFMHVKLSFSDPVGSEDFYQLLFSSEKVSGSDSGLVKSSEIIEYDKADHVFKVQDQGSSSIGNIDFQGLFNDYSIEGETYRLNVDIPIGYFLVDTVDSMKTVRVDLFHLSPDCYYYFRSRIISDAYADLPIFDPVKIYSNVNGGYGVFAGLSSDSDTLVVK